MAFPIIEERKRVYTRDDLRALAALPENADKQFELINGEIYEVAAAELIHTWIVAILHRLLGNFVEAHHLGMVFPDGAGYDMPNGATVIPDVSYVSNDRLPDPRGYLFIAPDLAVEVHSPSNKPRLMSDKIASYLEAGTRRVWVNYPDEQVIDVHRLLDDGSIAYKTYGVGDSLSGEDVLPGLTLPVAGIFPKISAPQS